MAGQTSSRARRRSSAKSISIQGSPSTGTAYKARSAARALKANGHIPRSAPAASSSSMRRKSAAAPSAEYFSTPTFSAWARAAGSCLLIARMHSPTSSTFISFGSKRAPRPALDRQGVGSGRLQHAPENLRVKEHVGVEQDESPAGVLAGEPERIEAVGRVGAVLPETTGALAHLGSHRLRL